MEGTDLNWRKSSYSGNGGGECVEIGASPGAVVVRDTTDRTGPMLWFTPTAWRRFADQVKRSLAPCRFPLNSSNSRASFPLGFQVEDLRGN